MEGQAERACPTPSPDNSLSPKSLSATGLEFQDGFIDYYENMRIQTSHSDSLRILKGQAHNISFLPFFRGQPPLSEESWKYFFDRIMAVENEARRTGRGWFYPTRLIPQPALQPVIHQPQPIVPLQQINSTSRLSTPPVSSIPTATFAIPTSISNTSGSFSTTSGSNSRPSINSSVPPPPIASKPTPLSAPVTHNPLLIRIMPTSKPRPTSNPKLLLMPPYKGKSTTIPPPIGIKRQAEELESARIKKRAIERELEMTKEIKERQSKQITAGANTSDSSNEMSKESRKMQKKLKKLQEEETRKLKQLDEKMVELLTEIQVLTRPVECQFLDFGSDELRARIQAVEEQRIERRKLKQMQS